MSQSETKTMPEAVEYFSPKIISEICQRQGVGEIGEFDRQAIRALNSAYSALKAECEMLSKSNQALEGLEGLNAIKIDGLKVENERLNALLDSRMIEIVRLNSKITEFRTALDIALRQWEMYKTSFDAEDLEDIIVNFPDDIEAKELVRLKAVLSKHEKKEK